MGKFNQTVRNKRKIKVENYHGEDNRNLVHNEMSKAFSRDVKFTILSIFIAVIVMITGSFAIFSSVTKQKDYNTLTIGNLKVDFVTKDNGNGNTINLNGAYPESDSEGLGEDPYSFEITNSGTVSASYIIKIVDDTNMINIDGCSDKLIDKSNLKVSVNGATPQILSDLESSSYIVDTGLLDPSESQSYDIRMWIKENANNSVLGKHYHGKIVIESASSSKNKNISAVYVNNENCTTGEESSCTVSRCTDSYDINSCPAGTIVKYNVNPSLTKYFYVLHDDGEELTLIERENTINGVSWYNDGTNTSGPKSSLAALEAETSSWTNVKEQAYALGFTKIFGNEFTGCNGTTCDTNKYTASMRNGRARFATVGEIVNAGNQSWLGGENYWLLNADSTNDTNAYYVDSTGSMLSTATSDTNVGIRGVVTVSK